MFALFETSAAPAERWYERLPWRKLVSGETWMEKDPRYLRTLIIWPDSDDDARRKRRTLLACETARRMGAGGAVLPIEFSYTEEVRSSGLAVSTPVPLYRRLGCRLAARAARESGLPTAKLRIALLARRPLSFLTEAALGLKNLAGTLCVWSGAETETLCYGLRKYGGMALLAQENPEADIYVLYEPPVNRLKVPDSALVLNLSGTHPEISGGIEADGVVLSPPQRLRRTWPSGCDVPSMLAALNATGQVRIDEIILGALTYAGKPLPLRIDNRAASVYNAI